MSKVGTGEGAQAYGHGYYAAESPEVATAYRDNLSKPNFYKTVGGKEISPELAGILNDAYTHSYYMPHLNGKQWSEETYKANANSLIEQRLGEELKNMFVSKDPSKYQAAQRLKDELSGLGDDTFVPQGYLYKLDIKPEKELFLDWDKPLSEQHPIYQSEFARNKAIADRYGYSLQEVEQMPPERIAGLPVEDRHIKAAIQGKGATIYQSLANELGGQDKATAALHGAGVPGIRYLDQGSRGAGTGTSNYVVFDPRHVDILEMNGQAVGGMPVVRK